MVRSLLLVLSTALIASCGGDGGSTQDGGPAGFAPTYVGQRHQSRYPTSGS